MMMESSPDVLNVVFSSLFRSRKKFKISEQKYVLQAFFLITK